MKRYFCWLIVFCFAALISFAQDDQLPTLHIGDPAPPLRIKEWIKGVPVDEFEKGKVYVIEFWATWCRPCKAAMPHLSAVSVKYKNSVTVVGIDIHEHKNTSIKKIRKFVDSMGEQMNYRVAVQDSNFMETGWILAAGSRREGIPRSFVINKDGRLAWIGHPKDIEKVLPQMVNDTWDIKAAMNKRNLVKHLEELDGSMNDSLRKYRDDDRIKPGDFGQPDAALLKISKIIKEEPLLAYAPFITYNTFASLLKTNQQKALEYGKLAIVTAAYNDEPPYDMIIGAIETYCNKLNLSAAIYQLGGEAYQVAIDYTTYPEIIDMYKQYHKMAAWYWLAKNKIKAVKAEQDAIVALKSQVDFSKIQLKEYELALLKYQTSAGQ